MDKLDYWVDKVCSEVKKIDPTAVIRISKDTIEDEDIDIDVYVPEGKKRQVQKKMSEMTSKILTKEGSNILALAMDKSLLAALFNDRCDDEIAHIVLERTQNFQTGKSEGYSQEEVEKCLEFPDEI